MCAVQLTIHHNGCGRGLYTLTFSVEMPFMDDDVFLAHCFPYTTADLHAFFASLQLDPQRSCYVNIRRSAQQLGTVMFPSSPSRTPLLVLRLLRLMRLLRFIRELETIKRSQLRKDRWSSSLPGCIRARLQQAG